MAVTGAITAAATIGSAVVGNQQRQKAKGQAAQVQRDSQAAQAAADAKAKQQHDQNIEDQSQAAEVARLKLDPNDPLRNAPASASAPTAAAPTQPAGLDPATARRMQVMGRAFPPTLLTPGRGRTTLLGE